MKKACLAVSVFIIGQLHAQRTVAGGGGGASFVRSEVIATCIDPSVPSQALKLLTWIYNADGEVFDTVQMEVFVKGTRYILRLDGFYWFKSSPLETNSKSAKVTGVGLSISKPYASICSLKNPFGDFNNKDDVACEVVSIDVRADFENSDLNKNFVSIQGEKTKISFPFNCRVKTPTIRN